MKLALRGAAFAALCVAASLVISAVVLQWLRFTPESIFGFRIALAVIVAVAGYGFVARPLMRRVTDEQVAMYSKSTSRRSRRRSSAPSRRASRPRGAVPALVRKLVESAIERCQDVEDGRRVERDPFRRYSGPSAASWRWRALFPVGPAYLRHALSAMLLLSRNVEAAVPYRIDVKPGNATLSRGADQVISPAVRLRVRRCRADGAQVADGRVRARAAGPRRRAASYEGMLFDVVGADGVLRRGGGVRSAVYTLKVVDMPYVQQLELEYVFPAYTGLQPQKIEDGGDIAVLRGTEVRVRAVTDDGRRRAAASCIDDKTQAPLAVQARRRADREVHGG